jgi:HTH-like domain
VTEKFEFIDAEYAAYQESGDEYVPSLVKMCIWMEVSRSGFYEWRNAPESATAKRRGILALYVRKSFGDSEDTYGYRRVHADLAAWGVRAGPELVRSLMREPSRSRTVSARVAPPAAVSVSQCAASWELSAPAALALTAPRIPLSAATHRGNTR